MREKRHPPLLVVSLVILICILRSSLECVNLTPRRRKAAPVSSPKQVKAKDQRRSNRMKGAKFYIPSCGVIPKRGKRTNKEIFKLRRGCGTTCSYEWVERDDDVEVKICLAPDVTSDDIQCSLRSDYLFAKLKNKPQSLIEGKLKGQVDTNQSTWFLEKGEDFSLLMIHLKKKKDRGINEWVGVIEKENILHLSYDNASSGENNFSASAHVNAQPNELLLREVFPNAKADDVFSFILKWANTKSNGQNEFGIPRMKLKTVATNDEDQIEIIITGFDLKWEAEDSLVIKFSSLENGVEVNVHRGKVASGVRGLHGNMVSFLVKECEQRVLKKLQHDLKGVFYLNPTSKKAEMLMHRRAPQTNYDYVSSGGAGPQHISVNREELSGKPTKGGSANGADHGAAHAAAHMEKGTNTQNAANTQNATHIRKDSPQEELIVEELKLHSKVNLTCEDKSKEPEFMKHWSEEKKVEFRRNSVLQLKKNLEMSQENKLTMKMEDYVSYMKVSFDLSDEEAKLVWRKGMAKSDEQKSKERFYRFVEVERLTDRIGVAVPGGAANPAANSLGEEDSPSYCHAEENPHVVDLTRKERLHEGERTADGEDHTTDGQDRTTGGEANRSDINRRFFNCLEEELLDPEDKPKLTLHEMYIKSDQREKQKMREKWKLNELRLNTLISELAYAEEDMIPTICNNYRDVLLSDEYACLMRIRLLEAPPKNAEEKRILKIVNSFALSLYDDIKIIMEHEEREHLKKIQLICEKAIHDEKGLNEFIESMKPLLDYSFLGYIKHAIRMEKRKIKMERKDFREQPSDWLIILMIIQKGIYSILEKDIWEDVINITTIICQEQPSVRKTMLTTMVASMPKADWIFFKDVIKTIYKSVQERKLTANHFPEFPHIPEAIFQLNYDVERILPDWFIRQMLDEYDKSVVELMKSRKPLFWKMKETNWDKTFVDQFKRLQVQQFQRHAAGAAPAD
ncbi:CS domain protein, putative [Plasmodium vivax]|uniref:NudC domain-containing protein 1 n=6 Tax=Plasmodium vivax TaxID=5855 RepID=A5K6R6_PLAVS|nr:hypothetical protein, conserved [Plasmodium vivax]KMZ81267.1 hypothetical protein PVIIG_04853 [Plasmodium vivax India VII]KMZ87412.1 hypothetical protein PVBG_04121 [Plasmodium vivax Brazil I]KMZ94006.1 hypothetical protein PVMG_03173 [Plasmodium vivax Mauritania I]KNA00402.1 hypothetical protein PVNG_01036 [Plasmodium vivax North Korean]EDL45007.1 hypothetical protein, conserved [Plasmodium vivax]|eukprot:XP_001614734.1 hypothetical protein [Plasmodium vivax Sal-1]